ncbi:8-oxo-dGTP diphosphatase [Methylobacterium phyllostachyos]|uniref:8-oxo-dGTP diphosphatase n=1 Tax=Methylobacterium phyllostachyos TaxID=582672 RepID=A0A1G9T864_9HYPH|nr:NUDIX hydrolase [Methylobacterium phyllostachyos]SDM43871.1 8-oxo-dGTP diphosphatase [Methylobacterium phyllostachyos]
MSTRFDIWDGTPFSGAKIALTWGAAIIAYRRDDRPDIPFPACWDLPGGGREGAESPVECALRETEEEFGLVIDPGRIVWLGRYPSWSGGAAPSYFLAAPVTAAETAGIRFGTEGSGWMLMPATDFVAHPEAVPHLRDRLEDYLRAAGAWPERRSQPSDGSGPTR